MNTLNNEVVLIVDDNAENHEIIEAFLKDIQIQCDHAFDCIEAVTLCTSKVKKDYALILMDINLPHIDGIETTKRLRTLGVSSPVVAVTAISKRDSRKDMCEEIFDSILYKPFSFHDLHYAITPYLKGTPALENKVSTTTPDRPLDELVCDFQQGISNMGGSQRLFTKHARNFKSNNFDLCPRLTEMITCKEYSEAALLCHSVKGLAGMLGFTSLYNNIVALEDSLHSKTIDHNELAKMLTLIDSDIRSICQIQF